jgi:hypothetical protein
MEPLDMLGRVTTLLAKRAAPYLVDGEFAASVWGGFESGASASVIVDESKGLTAGDLGADLEKDFEVNCAEESWDGVTSRWMRMRLPRKAFVVNLHALRHDDEYELVRFARRVAVTAGGYEIAVPRAEDVVLELLRWGKIDTFGVVRYQETLRNVLHFQAATLDLSYIRSWCDKQGTRQSFEQFLRARAATVSLLCPTSTSPS